ncbi:MAG: hypothetical protein KDE35_13550 [Geminicoccaceae bacterium]|nr:hypothetical protein [Geminicoccaceae bacterium]
MLAAFPLLAIPVAIYNALVFAAPDVLDGSLGSIRLLSGDGWRIGTGDLLLAAGLILLYLEIFKSTRTGTASIVDHTLSMLLFIVCLLEFVALDGFATSVFFLLTLMTLIDVVAGFTVTISTARRDFGIDDRARL